MADLFISYAQQSRDIAKSLAEALEARGYSVWWDPDILPAQQSIGRIDKELRNSRTVIVVWTPAAMDSARVLPEARYGWEHNKLISVCEPGLAGSLPTPFDDMRHVSVMDIEGIESALIELGVLPNLAKAEVTEVFDPELVRGKAETMAVATTCLQFGRELLNSHSDPMTPQDYQYAQKYFRRGCEYLIGFEESLPKLTAFLNWGYAITIEAIGNAPELISRLLSEASDKCPVIVPDTLPNDMQLARDDFERALRTWHAESAWARDRHAEILLFDGRTQDVSRVKWSEEKRRRDAHDDLFFRSDLSRGRNL